jgi:tagaturonate reductase
MRLSGNTLAQIATLHTVNSPGSKISLPNPSVFSLPEKVLQFGTGVFVRGLIDYYIDKANHAGLFNGRVVMVKSTDAGDIGDLRDQDGLYTLIMKSVDGETHLEERRVCAAISRVLDARTQWTDILACAANPQLTVVISNSTENGIALQLDEKLDASPPNSFPGKLLAFLRSRYEAFNGGEDSGLVILPTELIPGNGALLKHIVNDLAKANDLPENFIRWLNTANDFCDTLVDRIVPGKPPSEEHRQLELSLGYEDRAMVMAETYGLWAIEADRPRTKELLSFSGADSSIHVVPDISKFRELKLRLLNASHNLSCAVGYLCNFETVREGMDNSNFNGYMEDLILEDISMSIVDTADITLEDARAFGQSVLARYRNPYIGFEWLSICVQDTSKLRIRAVPVVRQHYEKYGFVSARLALSFAAYILFMHTETDGEGHYKGISFGREYRVNDDFAVDMHRMWSRYSGLTLVRKVLEDVRLWGTDLNLLTGFAEQVYSYLKRWQDRETSIFSDIKELSI